MDAGAAAIVVSNHGGRTLDGAIPTAEILPEIAEAVDNRVELLVDGGIRRGSDVLRALALGARAVLVGRPFLWGLAINGEAGQRRIFSLLRDELEEDARFCGIPDLTAVPRRSRSPQPPGPALSEDHRGPGGHAVDRADDRPGRHRRRPHRRCRSSAGRTRRSSAATSNGSSGRSFSDRTHSSPVASGNASSPERASFHTRPRPRSPA